VTQHCVMEACLEALETAQVVAENEAMKDAEPAKPDYKAQLEAWKRSREGVVG
jgi:hypothetical protein